MTPASGRFLLDTNILIALLAGDEDIVANLGQAQEVFIPVAALGELFFGASKSGRPAENLAKIERFAASRVIVPCDLDVAREYGSLKRQLKAKGKPIPENDLWIAATARRHGMILVTRDGHFDAVEELATTGWLARP